MTEKVCNGHYCQGQLKPLSEFYTHKRGQRQGKPFSECKVCWAWRRDNPPKGVEHVPVEDALPIFEELFRRIGQTATARRIGVAVDTISMRRLRAKSALRKQNFDAAKAVLDDARRNGEDGWSTREARIRNLNPILAGQASGIARQKVKADKELFDGLEDWQYEMAMDRAYSDNSWAYPDKDGKLRPFADFECKHDRLPGDKTPPCGCWPGEAGLTT